MRLRRLLDRRGGQLPPPALRFVRLRHHRQHIMARFQQRLKRRDGELRRPEKDHSPLTVRHEPLLPFQYSESQIAMEALVRITERMDVSDRLPAALSMFLRVILCIRDSDN